MAHMTVSVEYGLHSLLWLAVLGDNPRSGPDLAAFQGVSPSLLAKILVKLQKAGVVRSIEGAQGGYLLARAPEQITLLQVVDAIEGPKPLFDCQEIRGRCALFEGRPPGWATDGLCSIHAAMLKAEKAMRQSLSSQTLGDIALAVGNKAPEDLTTPVKQWFEGKDTARPARKANRRRRDLDHD